MINGSDMDSGEYRQVNAAALEQLALERRQADRLHKLIRTSARELRALQYKKDAEGTPLSV